MTTIMQPLREEHKELFPHIEKLKETADSVGESSSENLGLAIDEAYTFLRHDLIPHAKAEEEALYPVVERVIGGQQATATMSRDHVEVARLTRELGHQRSQLASASGGFVQAKELRRILYGLYVLVKVHFAKEEEIYLPLMEAKLSRDEAHDLFEAMEKAANSARLDQAAP